LLLFVDYYLCSSRLQIKIIYAARDSDYVKEQGSMSKTFQLTLISKALSPVNVLLKETKTKSQEERKHSLDMVHWKISKLTG
jgi:hypothetical protein